MKKTTIKDVAAMAGVSISVVSYVLNDNENVSISDKTKARVLEAAQTLNYIPSNIARSMRTGRSRIIGLTSFWDVSDKVFADFLKGAYQEAQKNDYSLNYCNIKGDEYDFRIMDLYEQKQIDGAILFFHIDSPDYFNEGSFVKKLKKRNIPFVIVDGSTSLPDINYVYVDYYHTTQLAVNYLHDLGHRRFAYLLPDREETGSKQAGERLRGYRETIGFFDHMGRDFTFDMGGAGEVIHLIKNRPSKGPTAIVANKSKYGAKLLKAFWESGISVPDDVSVIGCNDDTFAEYLTPPLTTVKVPFGTIGEKTARILLEILDDTDPKCRLKFKNQLVVRDSCKPVFTDT